MHFSVGQVLRQVLRKLTTSNQVSKGNYKQCTITDNMVDPCRPEPLVVIIGAGIAGLSVAQRLAQCGLSKITVLEATDRLVSIKIIFLSLRYQRNLPFRRLNIDKDEWDPHIFISLSETVVFRPYKLKKAGKKSLQTKDYFSIRATHFDRKLCIMNRGHSKLASGLLRSYRSVIGDYETNIKKFLWFSMKSKNKST